MTTYLHFVNLIDITKTDDKNRKLYTGLVYNLAKNTDPKDRAFRTVARLIWDRI